MHKLLIALATLFLCACCCVVFAETAATQAKLPLPGYGIINPSMHHQRYRYKEYSQSRPFYQWWYYYLQDFATNKHYAFAYGFATCSGVKAPKCIYDTTYLLFAEIDNEKKTRFQKYETYPLSNAVFTDDFHMRVFASNASHAVKNNEAPLFELYPINDDTYQLTGYMRKDSPNAWVSEGCPLGMEIKWNVTLSRVYGYYGQDIFEKPDEILKGVIQWNTYSHNALVRNGVISIDGNIITMDHDTDPTKVRYRGYGDGNWGQLMPGNPTKPDDKTYAWGWYLTKIPNSDPSKDVSVIAGVGKTYTGFPFYTMQAGFADVRVNSSLHLEFRDVHVYGQTFQSCNDGKVHQFNVERTNWAQIKDKFGVSDFPLSQKVTLESDNYLITQDCNSDLTNYNRLLFTFENEAFSDFEGLGVTCKLTIMYKPTKSVLIEKDDILSGIEYGFKFKIDNVPPLPFIRLQ